MWNLFYFYSAKVRFFQGSYRSVLLTHILDETRGIYNYRNYTVETW